MVKMYILMDIIEITHRFVCVFFQGLCEYMCLICIDVLNLWTYVWPSTN